MNTAYDPSIRIPTELVENDNYYDSDEADHTEPKPSVHPWPVYPPVLGSLIRVMRNDESDNNDRNYD